MHILIIGAMRASIKKLIEINPKVSWINYDDNYIAGDGEFGAQSLLVLRDKSHEALTQAVQYIHHQDTVDLIVAFHDDTQVQAARVAESLSIPHNVSIQTVLNTQDKFVTRQIISEGGLHQGNFEKVKRSEITLNNLITDGDKFIKPVSGTGSQCVFKVNSNSDIKSILEQVKSSNFEEFIIEDLLIGNEYSVESFSDNGKHHILGITQKFVNDNYIESGHLFPAQLSIQQTKEINNYICECLNLLGFVSGPAHSELILTEEGPVLIESHTRVGGDRIPDLVKLTCQVDLDELVVKQAMNVNIEALLDKISAPEGYASVQFLADDLSGTFVSAEFPKQGTSDGVIEYGMSIKEGQKLKPILHSFDRYGYAIATSDDANLAVALADDFLRQTRITISNSK